MVRSMIAMAQDIGYRVVAEGVETEEVLELLKSYGCDEVQGYFIARPLYVTALEQFVADSASLPTKGSPQETDIYVCKRFLGVEPKTGYQWEPRCKCSENERCC